MKLACALLFSLVTLTHTLQGQGTVPIPIDISSIAGINWISTFDGGRTLPVGPQEFNDIPFLIPDGEDNAWIGFGDNRESATIDVNVPGVTVVHTLMATVWGARGPRPFASLTFTGSEGATFEKPLVGNRDIRDFLTPTNFTDNINGTTTIPAFLGRPFDGPRMRHRLDQQIIMLPPEFATQALESITVTDDAANGVQALILAAITVIGQEPHQISGACDAAGCQDILSPGAIVSIFGNFAPGSATSQSIPLPMDLDGFSIKFDGLPGALFGVFSAEDFGAAVDQANVQVPWELDVTSGTVEITVCWEDDSGTITSEPYAASVAAASPGLFVVNGTQAIVTNFSTGTDDVIGGSWAQPTGAIPGLATQPAAIGGVITVWAGGLGPATITPETGNLPQGGLAENTKTIRLLIDGLEAQILGRPVLQPSSVGLNQLNAIVPDGVTPGDQVSIVIEVECDDGTVLRSQPGTTIAVRAAGS